MLRSQLVGQVDGFVNVLDDYDLAVDFYRLSRYVLSRQVCQLDLQLLSGSLRDKSDRKSVV